MREADPRLFDAFEALTELEFADSAFAAAKIALDVLDDLLPCMASGVALYDINEHALRFVATKGFSADARRKAEVDLSQPSCIADAASSSMPILLEDAADAPRFDARVDAPQGMTPSNMLLLPIANGHRLRGLIQLIGRRSDVTFSSADQALATYVSDRIATFFAR